MRVISLLSLMILTGCTGQVVTSTRNVVIIPPENMMICNAVELPDSRNLTDIQVARLIARLYQENTTCQANMTAIRQYLERAQTETQRQ